MVKLTSLLGALALSLALGCGDSGGGQAGSGGSGGTAGGGGTGGMGGDDGAGGIGGDDGAGGTGGVDGCATGKVECDGVCIDEIAPTLTAIQASIFTPSCALANCHGDSNPPQGLNLSSVMASEDNLIEVSAMQMPMKFRVDPGDSNASYLMNKLLGVDISGNRMPRGDADGLCQAKIETVRDWIDGNAPID